MTCQDLALPTELLEQIAEPGLDSLPELIPLLLKPPGQWISTQDDRDWHSFHHFRSASK